MSSNNVPLFSKKVIRKYTFVVAALSALASFYFIVVEIPDNQKPLYLVSATLTLILIYILIWAFANWARHARLDINGSVVHVKVGDIFEEVGLKTIGFNEYFDTVVDDIMISKSSLNGQYISKTYPGGTKNLDAGIIKDDHLNTSVVETNSARASGKKTKYELGSIYVDGEYLLTAFTHFDEDNRAYLSLKDYVSCMLNFWDEVDRVYAGRSVAVPLMGSGITRFRDAEVQPQELLQLLLWTFKISRVKFKHPANATIVIHKTLSDRINFVDLN